MTVIKRDLEGASSLVAFNWSKLADGGGFLIGDEQLVVGLRPADCLELGVRISVFETDLDRASSVVSF